jgi:alpha-glucosidase (family GH31 glycosyl hydrolase)
MDFNMFGVPMIGADICGFIYDTTEELCTRWIEVGAFYPFSRNHNALGQIPQELYLWSNVAAAAKNALGMRYQLLPFFYTLFYKAHTVGDTVARALWMNFPTDATALTLDRQFMLGNEILISPVLDQGATSVNAYFPQGYWYNFAERTLAVDASVTGMWRTLSTPLTSVNVHIRGGSVLPLQQAAMTTTAGRVTPFTIVAALCPGGKAWGSLFWDDGEQINLDRYLSVEYYTEVTTAGGTFTATVGTNMYGDASNLSVGSIEVLGVTTAPVSATLNGVALSGSQMVYDATKKMVTFSGLGLKITQSASLLWK